MKVKIIKAKYDTYWYANCIGEIFEVEEDEYFEYNVIDKHKAQRLDQNPEEEACGWCIDKKDCEIVENNIL